MIETSTQNINLLSEHNFVVAIDRLKFVNPHITSVNIPGISLTPINISNGFGRLSNPGDNVDFETMTITFLVDEELRNFFEIWDWIVSIGFPDSFDQFKNAIKNKTINQAQFSDATIIINTNKQNPIVEITIKELLPISLSGISLSTNGDGSNLSCTASFVYTNYDYRRIESI